MHRTVTIVFAIFCAVSLGGCDTAQKKQDMADQAFNQVDCARAAGITGTFSTRLVVKGGKPIETFLPGKGVSKVQAAKANACMGV